ncbi:MAG: FkbM family methyltransferase [Alphaproteobacteria bacterium]|nr:FkbM family methyltransferase [Alphaproteobacteria bacterium]
MIFTYWEGANISPEHLPCVAGWRLRFPSFKVFGPSDVSPLVERHFPEYTNIYSRIRLAACRSDLARLLLLYEYGGLYVDAHVGPSDPYRLAEIFGQLTTHELVIFEKPWERADANDIALINGVLAARQGSEILFRIAKLAFARLADHWEAEKQTAGYVPYNVQAMTGAWVIGIWLLDRATRPVTIRLDYKSRVYLHLLSRDARVDGIHLYRYYQYRQPGKHWSERQKSEPLFQRIAKDQQGPPETVNSRLTKRDAVLSADEKNSKGNYADALNLLLPEISGGQDDYWMFFQIGRAYSGLRDRENAQRYFLAATETSYPYRVGALYELVKHDIEIEEFHRISLLEDALNLPGELMGKDEASHQKRFYYFQIHFLRALDAFKKTEYARCEDLFREAYRYSLSFNELAFRFDWVVDRFRTVPEFGKFAHLEYLRRVFLRIGMDDSIDYSVELNQLPTPSNVLEIGAMDGRRFDPLHDHLIKNKHNAVVVEPLPDMFNLLQDTYKNCDRIRFANVAIAEATGNLTLYRIKPEVASDHGQGEWVIGISSAIKGATLQYLDDIVTEEIVPALLFEEFTRQYDIGQFDVLQIDAEGYDWKILQQVDLKEYEVKLVHVEIINLAPSDRLAVFDALARVGFRYTYDGMNVTAIRTA